MSVTTTAIRGPARLRRVRERLLRQLGGGE
jgi:hypothetical protein